MSTFKEMFLNEGFDSNKNNIETSRIWKKGFDFHMSRNSGGSNSENIFFKNEKDMKTYWEENNKKWKNAQFYNHKGNEDFEKASRIKIK